MFRSSLGVVLLTAAAVSACHEPFPGSGAAALDGAYRGVVSDVDAAHASGEMLILDGLMLGYDYDRDNYYSATLESYAGDIAGDMQSRFTDGAVKHDFAVHGAWFDDGSIELAEAGPYADGARVSLFRNATLSDDAFAEYHLDGVYAMYGPDMDATLVIDPDGYVEGYDEFGCAYFGAIRSPNPSVNVHELSLDVSGCGYAADYAIGLATLDRSAAELVVTLWFDRDDRVEAWVMQRH